MRAALALLAGLGLAVLGGGEALAAPDCPGGPIQPRILYRTGDTLEYGIFDPRGRFFFSDDSTNLLMRIDHLGDTPRRLSPVGAPGAIVFAPDGSIVMGTGDALQNGVSGDISPRSGLVKVNPDTGATKLIAAGLGMANGIAMGPDGAIYATNDLGFDVDRVVGGKVTHPWARVYSANGVVLSPDHRYLYVSQTFAPAAIQRITIANPSQVSSYAVAQGADMPAGLDDMTIDAQGNLYVAANGAGQVWKVNTSGAICLLATGFHMPSAVNFGVGANARDLFVVAFDGTISELPDVLGSQVPPASPSAGHRPPASHRRGKHHRRNHHARHRSHRRRPPPCGDPDHDRDCD